MGQTDRRTPDSCIDSVRRAGNAKKRNTDLSALNGNALIIACERTGLERRVRSLMAVGKAFPCSRGRSCWWGLDTDCGV